MSDIDTADALLGDDDGDDYDLGQDEEAELLRDDDGDEPILTFQADPLEDDDDEDTHRDKFASERSQQQNEQQETVHSDNVNREYNHRFNRGRGGGSRGRGRGGFKNGPGRIGNGKCYVNPSFLQGKKPVQSVQPSLYKQRNFEPKRRVLNPPFITQQRFQHQPIQQQQQYHQPFVQPISVWQPPPQQPQPPSQSYYDGSMQQPVQQQQQCYQPPIQHNAPQFPQQQQFHNQSQQYPYEGLQNNQNQNFFPNHNNSQPHINANSNYAPSYGGSSQQPHFQPPAQQHFQNTQHFNPPQTPQISHQPQHHTPQNTQPNNYYDLNHHTPHQSPIFNNPPNQHNSGFNPPQKHSAPLLQRPSMCFTHEQGQFQLQPQPRFQQRQQPLQQPQQRGPQQFNQPRQDFHQVQHNTHGSQFRPRQSRPHFNSQYGQSQRGSYQGRQSYINRQQQQPIKRHFNWRDNQAQDLPKRRSWNDYNQQYEEEQETQEEYYGEGDEPTGEESQKQNVEVAFSEDRTPDIEDDDETRAYRLKIEEQKRRREEILAEKERKRKLAILKKTGQVCDIPALQTSPPQQQRPKPPARIVASNINPNLRVLTRSDGDKVALLSTPNVKVTIKPGVAPTKMKDLGDKPKLTAGFLSTRKVLAKDNTLLDTPVVVVRNLAATSTEAHLRKMCNGIGLLQSLDISPKERHAKIRFKSVASAHAFYKKYQRYMLDLSMIQVELVAE